MGGKKLFARLCVQSTTPQRKCHAAGRAAPRAAPSGAAAPPAARAAKGRTCFDRARLAKVGKLKKK